jgi:betaine-aldehyde dehydrogenase
MKLQSSNNGKPQFEAAIDVDDVIATFEYYAGLAEGLDAQLDSNVALPSDDFSARLRREPCGVVGLIVPWNFPMVTTAWKLAPALAAGCCVVLKPSEVTPLPELELAAIIAESGCPTACSTWSAAPVWRWGHRCRRTRASRRFPSPAATLSACR